MSRQGYKASNTAAIKRAFQKLKIDEKLAGRFVVGRATSEGSQYVIEAHELHSASMLHPQGENTHAYALAEKGQIIPEASFGFSGLYDDKITHGDAREMAERLARASKASVTGVVLSKMEGENGQQWYNEELEKDFMYYAMDQIVRHSAEYVESAARHIGGQ